MRDEVEILDRLCAKDKQINMYLKHYQKYSEMIIKANGSFRDLFVDRAFKYRQKQRQLEIYLSMLVGMKSELLWVFEKH